MSAEPSPYGLPPEEAIKYIRAKGYKIAFDWEHMIGEEHARAFTVAKATQLDLLQDMRAAVEKAIANGTTLATFRKELTPILQSKGWWGEKVVQELDKDGNPVPGSRVLVQLGSAHRLRTIYETNLRTAQSAGRWERIQRTADRRPYLRYVALEDGRTRKEHLDWHNTVLRWDDPWWNTHYPPNGWGCRCKVQQLSDRDLARYGYEVASKAPPIKLQTVEAGGATFRVPKGIDPSFAYNVGQARGDFAAMSGAGPAPWNSRRTYAPQEVDQAARRFSAAEKAIADFLARSGNEVVSRSEKPKIVGDGKKFDAFVNGYPTEFKSPQKSAKGGVLGLLRASIRGGPQAANVIVDVRGHAHVTEASVRAEVTAGRRHLKNRLQHVRIIGTGFDITISELSWP